MRNAQIQIMSAGDLTGNITGSKVDVNQVVSLSICPVVSGGTTAAGTLKVQVSNDVPSTERVNFTPTNWADIPNATSAISSGVGPAIVISNACFSYIRVVYTRSSGGTSETLACNMNVLSI